MHASCTTTYHPQASFLPTLASRMWAASPLRVRTMCNTAQNCSAGSKHGAWSFAAGAAACGSCRPSESPSPGWKAQSGQCWRRRGPLARRGSGPCSTSCTPLHTQGGTEHHRGRGSAVLYHVQHMQRRRQRGRHHIEEGSKWHHQAQCLDPAVPRASPAL